MCGIVGYVGRRQAQAILLGSLAKLEYRGYDSCGIALASPALTIHKDAVRVAALAHSLPELAGTSGIGHTRWATHGAPCKVNSHPHTDCTGHIAVVHNGVITNYQELTERLKSEGHTFTSETDTEVIAHLIEKYYFRGSAGRHSSLKNAVDQALLEIRGTYAIIVLVENESGLVIARKDSPLVVGLGDGENFIASDVPAILNYTNRVIYLDDGDRGIITANTVEITHDGQSVKRDEQKILWSAEQAQKAGYDHYLIKEIHEQPRVIRETLAEYLTQEPPLVLPRTASGRPASVMLVACGTSFYAATIGKYLGESLLGSSFRAELASELNYLDALPPADAGIALTQSGETLDTLNAMKRLKSSGIPVLAITNVVGSTASKVADQTLYTRAGPEISVAASKTFTAQLVALYWMIITDSRVDAARRSQLIRTLRQMPEKLQRVLSAKESIIEAAERLAASENVFYIGRGISYAVALEGALKLKEVAYIHSEAYAAGEIKHGPFALLSTKTPVVAVVARDNTREPMLTSIKEIKARGAPVLAIAQEEDEMIEDLADEVLRVPSLEPLFSPFVNTVVVQLIAYYAARKRGCPIDFPRNLAKSVTVE